MIKNNNTPSNYSKENIKKYKNELLFHIDFTILNTDHYHKLFSNNKLNYSKLYDYIKYHLNVLENSIFFENFTILKDHELKSLSHLKNIGLENEIITMIYKEIINYSSKNFPLALAKDIKAIYQKFIDSFDEIEQLANNRKFISENILVDISLYNFLITGDYEKSEKYFLKNIRDMDDFIKNFENKLIPILNKIGLEWELNNISVSKEHLAINIINHIITTFFSKQVKNKENHKANIVLCNIEGENHNLIINLIDKSLQHLGYKTYNLSSSIPNEDLLEFIKDINKLDFVILSCTLQSNLTKVYDLIDKIKKHHPNVISIIGGAGFKNIYDPKKVFAIDYYCHDIRQVLDILK